MLAISNVRQTNKENPSAFPVDLISLYCGINGTIPPNIMAPAATVETTSLSVTWEIMVNRGSEKETITVW
jgi:hypothetical protein